MMSATVLAFKSIKGKNSAGTAIVYRSTVSGEVIRHLRGHSCTSPTAPAAVTARILLATSSHLLHASAFTGQEATHAGGSPAACVCWHKSHLRIANPLSVASACGRRATRMTPNGQASTQNAQPMHRSCRTSTGPASSGRHSAPERQTRRQGASSQCRHCNGTASRPADSM